MKAIDLLHDTEEMIESHKAIKKAVKYFIKEYGENQMLDVIQDENGDWILQPITHRHDVVGVPGVVYRALQRVPFDPLITGRMTAFDYIETTLGIRLLKLDTTNATRAVGYRRDMSVLELPMPIPYALDTGYQFGPYKWNVPGLGRIGGVQVHKKDGMRYLDGVAA